MFEGNIDNLFIYKGSLWRQIYNGGILLIFSIMFSYVGLGQQTRVNGQHTDERSLISRNARAGANVSFSPYLIKDPSINDFMDISPRGISVYSSIEAKLLGRPECRIYPDEYERFVDLLTNYSMDKIIREYQLKGTQRWGSDKAFDINPGRNEFRFGANPRLPLSGLRVAVDPGHIANYMELAEIEGKYVKMRSGAIEPETEINFFEAELTLPTAYLIKRSLESLGASVFITRIRPGRSVDGLTFEEWKLRELDKLLDEEVAEGNFTAAEAKNWKRRATEKELFKWYNEEDLEKRVAIINQFNPHLTLVVHFNVHEPNWANRDAEGYLVPTDENYVMAFVPGAFLKEELVEIEDRIHFLRLLLTDQVDQSIQLAESFIVASQYQTHLSPVNPSQNLSYLELNSIKTNIPGVYARNLRLTRKVKSPICYGESLCQDNVEEAVILNRKDKMIQGIPYSSRLESVAEAYVNAVLEFAGAIGK